METLHLFNKKNNRTSLEHKTIGRSKSHIQVIGTKVQSSQNKIKSGIMPHSQKEETEVEIIIVESKKSPLRCLFQCNE